jgi:hypothetical protein
MKYWTTLALALGICAVAGAQTFLYQSTRLLADQQIRVAPWGSGLIAETDETAFEGTHSVRISTRSLFQGGRMTFGQPVAIAEQFADKNNLLKFVLKLPDATAAPGGGGPGMIGPGGGPGLAGPGGVRPGGGGPAPGAPGGLRPGGGRGGGGGPGMMGPGGLDDDGGGGLLGAGGPAAGAAVEIQPLTKIRFVITTTDGKRSEAYLPVMTSIADEQGWRHVAIPLQSISGLDRTNKTIREIALAGNSTATFWLGEMRLINDTTAIRGEPNFREANIGLGEELEFVGHGFGGSSILRYTWDFDSGDGIQAEAEGQVVRRRFRTPGEFTVTLTISDFFGLKEPYSTTLTVKVNP